MGTPKVRREILSRLPPGFSLPNASGSSHLVLHGPDGLPVRRKDGRPLTISCTPGYHSQAQRALREIRRLGIEVR